MKNVIKIFLGTVIFQLMAGSCYLPLAVAQTSQLPLNSRQSAPLAAAQEKKSDEGKLYLDFKGAALINVLSVLSELANINFVAGKEISGRQINMVLDDVTLNDALDAISKGSNVVYDYIAGRNIYLFRATSEKEDQPPLITRVFKLYYIWAYDIEEMGTNSSSSSSSSSLSSAGTTSDENSTSGSGAVLNSTIMDIIKDILSDRGKANVDVRSNSIVITDTEDRVRMIEQVIADLDRPVNQVLIHVILVETYESLDRYLGVSYTNQTNGSMAVLTGGETGTQFPFNTTLMKRMFKIDKDTLNKAGTTWPDTELGTVNFNNMAVTLQALQTASKLKILAKPRILVLDNHPANIQITTEAAVGQNTVATTIGSQSSGESVTTTERSTTGTSLQVVPLINSDSRITLTLEPRFATAASSTAITSSNTADTTVRTARTTMMVNDGQTVVLGGLLSSQQTATQKKVPILADIPVIGRAFTLKTNVLQDRELVLFVTPRIIRNPAEVQAVSVPDEHERMEDIDAQFWKVKRKKWFQDLVASNARNGSEADSELDTAGRIQSMDQDVEKLMSETTSKSLVSIKKTVEASDEQVSLKADKEKNITSAPSLAPR